MVEAEDALIAALKVKTEHPEARIMYVRPQNRRGDARHPVQGCAKDRLRGRRAHDRSIFSAPILKKAEPANPLPPSTISCSPVT